MKKYASFLLAFVIIFTLLLTSCGGDEYKDLTKLNETEDVFYIGVRKDMTLVSNIYESVSLTDFGLSKNAYLIWGDSERMYFANEISNGSYTQIMEYTIESKMLDLIYEFSASKLVFSPDGVRFYSAYVEEKNFFGYRNYYRCIDMWDRDSGEQSNVHREEVSEYPKISKDTAFIREFVASVSEYAWVVKISDTDYFGHLEDYSYFANKNGNAYQPQKMDWSDPVWNYLQDHQGYVSGIFHTFDTYGGGRVVLGVDYKYSSGLLQSTSSVAYFEYTFGSQLRFITADYDTRNPITAIYTFN